MAYLLEITLPGVGHIASGRWLFGTLLSVFWCAGLTLCWLAASFDLHNLALAPAVHLLLSFIGVVRLAVLKRREQLGKTRVWVAALCFLLVPSALGGSLYATTRTMVRPIVIRSGSMLPSIRTGDIIVGQLFSPSLFGVDFGDIVLVLHPTERGRLIIKRILGMEGDLIEVRGGEVYRNGRPLSQCRLRAHRDPEKNKRVVERLEVLNKRPYLVWDQPVFISKSIKARVPAGHVFVVGDNRDRSGDSRAFGAVPVSSIKGRVRVRIFPTPTNELDRAPLDARKAASRLCRRRGRHPTKGRNDE